MGEPLAAPAGLPPRPAFYGLPADTKDPPAAAIPLYEVVHRDGRRRAYSTDGSWTQPGYERAKQPLCLVWRNP